jgi:shikimate dehydrogenase
VTDRYAVVGNPIAQSLSPQIHRAFAEQTGEKILYEKLLAPIGGFAEFAGNFFSGGGRGLNITLPFKLDACAFADQLSERAQAAGAVNTLARRKDGSILGDNTDGAGLVADILQNLRWSIEGKKILLLGAGGAARGVLLPLLREKPAGIYIANRTAHKARQLAGIFSARGPVNAGGLEDVPADFDLLINASSASLSGELPTLAREVIGKNCNAYDMVYAAQATPFMCWAQEYGARVADGLGMLVGQAAESFYLWRGVRPEVAPVLAQLREQLTNKIQS